VPDVGVLVPLDGDELRVGRQEDRRLEALVVAPQARWQRDVASLVPLAAALVLVDVALPVHGLLVAEQLHVVAGVIAVQPDPEAGGCVAVAPGVNEAHVGDGVVVGDGVHALAVVPVGAGACAARAGSGSPTGKPL